MSDTLYPPFLKWGEYKSKDEQNPDVLNWEVIADTTFETEYGICTNAKINGEEKSVSLYSFNSPNKQLLLLWNDAVKEEKIKPGVKFKLLSWKGQSKTNKDREIRRFKLVF